ncbi:MAG TPA: FAD-dependent monooxygenase, partial [Actinomycetota bacterium]|nr:FAD-dependent monooxygenase [Actinomycetota bacterium]
LALQRVGLPARVYEQAPEIGAVGAGIGLWPGALQSLREIGVAQWFWELPVCPFRWARTATTRGRQLVGFPVAPMTGGLGYVVRRADLHRALLEPLDPEAVLTGKRLVTLVQDADGVALGFADGTTAHAGLVIGADGLRSVVREAVLGRQEPRYSGETAYRGMAAISVADPGLMCEMQGGGRRGAVHPVSADHVYWWSTRRAPRDGVESPEQRKGALLEALARWAGGLPEAIEATPAQEILQNDLYDRDPVAGWSSGRVTLLGDAAHPTTPNLGLGGCMAIEDALVLARALRQTSAYGPAFAQYEFERHTRTAQVVRVSRWMGRTGSLRNPLAVAAWRGATAATPARVAAGMLTRQVTYTPGPLVS